MPRLRMLSMLAAVAALSLPGPGRAEPPPAAPRLVVAIVVDQFSADLFAQYRPHFTGGMARLLQGAVFPSAYQSHAATETCPGHSTILTGDHPARTGIIANAWYDLGLARTEHQVYCAEDETDPASRPREPVVSAAHLKVPTLGEWLKRADPRSRNVAVSAKDRAVVMMGGQAIDAAYWFKGQRFVTFRGREEAPAAAAVNAAVAAELVRGARALPVPKWCAARAVPVSAGAVTVGQGRFALAPNRPEAFRASPRMDQATLDLAARLAGEMKLGQGPASDVLSVSLSATDYIGHATGHQGVEMCIQLARLDSALGAFFAKLDAARLDYVVVLTADHGGTDLPERLDRQALPGAARVDRGMMPAALGRALAAELGLAGAGPWVYGDGAFGDFYLSRAIPPDRRAAAASALAGIAARQPHVAAAFTSADLAAAAMPSGDPQDWTLLQRARASFDPERSGDVVVLLRRGVSPIVQPREGSVATHGSPWDYDRRVPLLFWRKGIRGFEQPAPVETVDIAPSLAALLGLHLPAGTFDGRCLDLDGGVGDTCKESSRDDAGISGAFLGGPIGVRLAP